MYSLNRLHIVRGEMRWSACRGAEIERVHHVAVWSICDLGGMAACVVVNVLKIPNMAQQRCIRYVLFEQIAVWKWDR